jgi:hypothetical protein
MSDAEPLLIQGRNLPAPPIRERARLSSLNAHGRGYRFAAQTDIGSAQTSVNPPRFDDRDLGRFDEAQAAVGFHRGFEFGLRAE